ncbi:TolC family protein [Euzebyella saccharophila]|uniref:TolC family protein n=1 Tax=Euzebyella saccharophila TaxID=679664 RepID=A0ABV8JX35_9FLAO|nr:TolC family protein [Euzebyella saccharophila]
MYKFLASALCGCLCSVGGFAQTDTTGELLDGIAQNNAELKAYRAFIESRQLENRSGNNLPDPQLSAFYLPHGDNSGVEYSEYQISQSFEFPTVYAARGKWNDQQAQELETEYDRRRQDVLLKANKLLVDFTTLQKQKELERTRREQSKRGYDQIRELFKKEQVGILDLNKAKIAWIQEQFVVEQTEIEIRNALILLEKLNGGEPIDPDAIGLQEDIEVESLETLWQAKMAQDPELRKLGINESVSRQKITLERNKVLPDLTAGYNYQGVSGNNFSGFYGGVSIPLWNSRNKVKAAKTGYEYRKSQTEAVTATLYAGFREQYNRYQLLLKKYREYRKTMESLDSESLLFKAFQLGELSFMDYYVELRFYRDALDTMLQMEKELYQLKAELLKHQL